LLEQEYGQVKSSSGAQAACDLELLDCCSFGCRGPDHFTVAAASFARLFRVATGWSYMAAVNLIGSYNYALVSLSVLIAMFASYAALDLAGRITAAGGWTRAVWLLGGAGAMGTGIWSMHYIGMLAFMLPIPVAYHWPTVLLSLFAAILASVVALGVVSRQKMGWFRALAGSVLMGAGIASMHYIGMAAMRLPAICQFNFFLVVLSVVVAVLISLAALWITFHFRDEKTGSGWEKLAGAVVMGAAIPVMHYTGMAAASFTPSGKPTELSHAVSISTLGTAGIAAVTFIVLGLALLTSWVDRRFATQTLELQEEKLQRSEAYLAEAQRLSHTGSFGWRPSTGEILCSEETFRIFQYGRATKPTVELVLQRVHPEDVDLVKHTIDRASQDGKDFEHEYRLVMPDSSVKYVHVMAHALSHESGGVEFVGAVMDVSDRKQAEEALRRSEGYLAEAQRLTRTGSWAWSVATKHSVYWSQENYRLFGFDSEGGIPSDEAFYQRIHPEDRDRVRREVFLERPDEGSHFDVEFRIVLPDGAIKYVRSTGHPVRNISGDLLEYVGTSIDVTERKRADEERERLRQAQADLAHVNRVTTMGELTASLAHEVNQPIAAAITNANTCMRWLAADTPNLEEARAAAMRIVKDGTRAAEIIKRVRLLFKKGSPERELVDLNEVVRDMIVLLRSEATRYSISVRTELAADLPEVVGDRVQLQQVLMNLMINGIDAMRDVDGTRELVVKSERGEDQQALVSVSDTGVGLPQQQADQIFNAFFTTKSHGTGMGLRISRSIVESHGGRLWAAEDSPRGASFYVSLPTKAEALE
jgi:PAS domain S-box-containing protein